jgi:DNA-directed RNA polymerase specialized sigma24 family protein
MTTDKKKKVHYVNNKQFLEAIVERKRLIKEAEETDSSLPQVTNYLGECILKIANHLSYRPNFINYTYRDEMISDGIENSLQYIDNFDPEKSKNPFAYFTQIIYFAFVRRITKEKKQQKIKDRILKRSNISDMIAVQDHDDDGVYQAQYMEFIDKYSFSDDDDDDKKKK